MKLERDQEVVDDGIQGRLSNIVEVETGEVMVSRVGVTARFRSLLCTPHARLIANRQLRLLGYNLETICRSKITRYRLNFPTTYHMLFRFADNAFLLAIGLSLGDEVLSRMLSQKVFLLLKQSIEAR